MKVPGLFSGFFKPKKLEPHYFLANPMLLFRKDTRPINLITENGGFKGRHFSGIEKDLRSYLQTNHPSIGFGSMGFHNLPALIDWKKEEGDYNIHSFVTGKHNRVIDAFQFTLDHNVGSIPEPMSSAISAEELANEREMIVLGDILSGQFIASIHHKDLPRLQSGEEVPNQLRILGLNDTVPKMLSIRDFTNLTAMLHACTNHGCDEKAHALALLITPEQLMRESRTNQYPALLIAKLESIIKTAQSTQEQTIHPSPTKR